MIDESKFADFGAMEFFLMAVVSRAGLSSMYELQQKAALQPGGIRPTLQRLEQLNLIRRGSSTARRKRELTLTEDGEEVLQSWRRCLKDTSDTDAALRVLCIALLMDGFDEALWFAEQQAANRQTLAELRTGQAEQLKGMQRDPLSTYSWIRLLIEAHRRNGESQSFSIVSHFLKEYYQTHGSNKP